MIFFADEGLDAPMVELLRKEGYKVRYAVEEMSGATDMEILAQAFSSCNLTYKGQRLWRNDYPASN
jgi:hypothetical protein